MITAVKEAREHLYGRREKETAHNPVRVPEMCRRKLLHYAESFRELARSLDVEEEGETSAALWGDAEREENREKDRREVLAQRRSVENRMLISHNLCEVAQIMTHLADELFRCRPMEDQCRKYLLHALRAESIYADHFCYLAEQEEETHAVSMTLSTDIKGGCPASRVADMLSVLLKRPLQLSVSSPYLVEREPHNFVFMEEADFVTLTGFCKVTKESETVSGDHYSVLESEKGKVTLLLSDGTGSGEQASRDSEKVLDLMEKLLEAEYEPLAAADMVNLAFYAGEREYSHPTLDICDLDLYDGSCLFCKVGGAVSFLKRGTQVERICQGSLPLGVFRRIQSGGIRRQLEDGDYVILMTDGVSDAFGGEEGEEMLREIIADLAETNPGEIAQRLLESALCACGGHIRDDMTVLVAGIWENSAV
ncbi:MAG: SpoIIE family protein phosphatase [Muribaculum sp.]|nr:SpoIIE family protein phosphatase [Muribaculum sp.]